jgi:3-deoxy-7-phosphoheptulonate synthase
MIMSEWSPSSWTEKPARQQPVYEDEALLQRVLEQLTALPPLVTSWEVEELKKQLAEAADGERFVLQGGDCAESFADCTSDSITSKLKILLQMSLALTHGLRKRVVRIGRMAGQYAKPRSADTESRDGQALPSYRGDNVNHPTFTKEERAPDPTLLLRGYERAALTLNFTRSLVSAGFADLHHPEYWNLAFVQHSPHAKEYEAILRSIGDGLNFMELLAGSRLTDLHRVDFYTSHEALLLSCEQAQTRRVPHRKGWYNLSTHFPWIGMRTAQPDGAHVEYMRGIRNPIAVKIGPEMDALQLLKLIDLLNPDDEPGRLTLIHRFGTDKIAAGLPPLIEVVQRAKKRVLWMADPMHGNTKATQQGIKTRRFEDIIGELEQGFDTHERMGSILGGIHFELTGEDVTECVGGARGLSEQDLARAYRTQVDPRLNYEQALEIAMMISRRAHRGRAGK